MVLLGNWFHHVWGINIPRCRLLAGQAYESLSKTLTRMQMAWNTSKGINAELLGALLYLRKTRQDKNLQRYYS